MLTAGISFLAVMIIPDDVRMAKYCDNLIGGLAMNVVGPDWAKLLLNAFVVVVGFLILAGAVNTAIIGSNGVLNRVAEDGVMPDWFLKPHPRYGTTYRALEPDRRPAAVHHPASRGDVLLLGEAYAFGVVWSFVFKALSMVVLRFKEPAGASTRCRSTSGSAGTRCRSGSGLIFLVLFCTAIVNFLTKEVATIGGVIFTTAFFVTFTVSERAHDRQTGKAAEHHEHLEQFNQATADEITPTALGLTKPYRKLVAIRSPHNLFMLEKGLAETDPETTDVVVMTAKVLPPGSDDMNPGITDEDRQLMTAVVNLAEKAGKQVKPLIVPTNKPFYALTRTARTIGAQELIMGVSNKFTPTSSSTKSPSTGSTSARPPRSR